MESKTSLDDTIIQADFINQEDFKYIRASIIDEILFDNQLMVTTSKFDRFAEATIIQDRFGEVASATFCENVNKYYDKGMIPCFLITTKEHKNIIVYGKLVTLEGYRSVIIVVPVHINNKHACNFRFAINKYDDGKLITTNVEHLINIEKVAEWCDPYSVADKYIDLNYSAYGIKVELKSFNVKESELSKTVKEMMNSIRK